MAIAAAAAFLVSAPSSGGIAQTPFSTLATPQGSPTASHSAAAPKPGGASHGKPCSDYGAGFVAVAGTDTCVKVGTAVRVDAAVSSHR